MNVAWRNRFGTKWVENGDSNHSDHQPVILHMAAKPKQTFHPKSKPQWFEAFWIKYEDCAKIVADSWSSAGRGTNAERVQDNLDNCIIGLLNWSKGKFGNLWKKIEDIEERIKKNKRGRITEESKKRDRMIWVRSVQIPAEWTKPPEGWIKVNFDGALLKERRVERWASLHGTHEGNALDGWHSCYLGLLRPYTLKQRRQELQQISYFGKVGSESF
ncbi:hypothetical protein Salat_1143300 [Sesamum alatum]|uniref:Reverse transcriptase n=1 Tax=Sesamum alatum TaxID=300844 RepID=A0AAE1YE47_9LAMI|nr:hypothetical protein Salat_1143300 [Sesamum alatum]